MQPARLSQIQQWNSKRCGIFSNLTMKKPEDYQCFLISPYKWGRSDGCSCIWICFKCYFSIIYFIWYMARYTMRQTPVTRSTSCKLAFKSTALILFEQSFLGIDINDTPLDLLQVWLFEEASGTVSPQQVSSFSYKVLDRHEIHHLIFGLNFSLIKCILYPHCVPQHPWDQNRTFDILLDYSMSSHTDAPKDNIFDLRLWCYFVCFNKKKHCSSTICFTLKEKTIHAFFVLCLSSGRNIFTYTFYHKVTVK